MVKKCVLYSKFYGTDYFSVKVIVTVTDVFHLHLQLQWFWFFSYFKQL